MNTIPTVIFCRFEDRLTADYSKPSLSLSECEDLLSQLQLKYPNEYKVSAIMSSQIYCVSLSLSP